MYKLTRLSFRSVCMEQALTSLQKTGSHPGYGRCVKPKHYFRRVLQRSYTLPVVDHTNVILTDKLLNRLSVDDLTPAQVSYTVQELHALAIKQLRHLPWLQAHHSQIAFIQLAMNNNVGELMGPVLRHPFLPTLLQAVVDNCCEFTNDQLVRCFASLVWVGISTDTEVVRTVQAECSLRADTFDIDLIGYMADAMRALNPTDLKIMRKLLQRLSDILPGYGSGKSNEAALLATSVTSCHHYATHQFIEDCVVKTLSLMDQPGSMDECDYLGAYLRMCRILNAPSIPESTRVVQCSQEIISRTAQQAVNLVDKMQAHHFAEICNNLKICRSYSKQYSSVLQSRAMQLLENSDITVNNVSNLLFAFTIDISVNTKRRLESILYQHLDDADVLVLTNLVDSLLSIRCTNRDIHAKLQFKIIEHMDNITKFASRFQRILRLLSHRNFYSPVLQAQFYNSVLTCLDEQHGTKTWSVSMISRYLLPSMQYFIPDNIFDKLMQIIPHCSLFDLLKIVSGLNNIQQPWTRQLQNQILQLQHLLHSKILQELSEVNDFYSVHQVAMATVVKCCVRDPLVTDKVLGFFPKYTKEMTNINMRKVASTLHRVSYYIPEVCDDIMSHVCRNYDTMTFDHLITALLFLVKVGHNPDPVLLEEFSPACLHVYNRHASKLDAKVAVVFAHALCHLQIYPRDLLQEIFRIEYLEQIDSYIQAVPHNRHAVETLLMKLNRQVILECPEMDIPWFHEQYCKDNVVSHKHSRSLFHQQLDNALFEILGDMSFYKAGSYTPYYYFNDFECILDQSNKPLVLMDVIGQELPPGARRLALLGLSESQYCYNSKHINGHEQLKIRHLELMGYTVIVIPHFKWFSMGLSEWSSKVDYLRNKLFMLC